MTAPWLDPLAEPPPALDRADAARILADAWGVEADPSPLHGERDLNFRVLRDSVPAYVLKVHNPADTIGVVDCQTQVLRHIAAVAPDLPVGESIPTRAGTAWTSTTDATGRECQVRLLSHLDGHHPGRDDLDESALFGWGRMIATLGRALRGFVHPDAVYPIAWDIRRLPALRAHAETLADAAQRRAVLHVMDRHDERVAATLARLRAQVVHNDLSRDNVLVDDRHRVTGITDFGDLTHTTLVCDLAVAIADVLDGRDDSVAWAEPIIAGYVSVTALDDDEASALADLVAGRCATSLAIQSWRQQRHPTLPSPGGGAWQLLQQLDDIGLDAVSARFAAAATAPSPSYPRRSTASLLASRARSLGPLELSYRRPLHLVRGTGVELYDADGLGYVDAYNNVPVLGHAHPAVTAAVSTQLRLLTTNSRYLHEAPVALAERLLATMPGDRFDRVLFVNSGSEANDLAWRIACFSTGNGGGIVTDFAYHGVTTVTTALSPEAWTAADRPSYVRTVDPPAPGPDPSTAARTVAAAAADLAAAGVGVAAMFVDGVFTSDGIVGPAHAWTADAVEVVHASGGLYVADEVQAGYGRTGDHLWSVVAGGVAADLVTLGKPMGNGFPVAAVVGRSEHVDAFMEATGYFSTFGGNTVACAAALAVLEAVEQEHLVANAHAVGGHLLDLLGSAVATHPALARTRGWGLAIGVDVWSPATGAAAPELAAKIVDGMRDRGVLIGRTGRDGSTLKIRPPLVFTRGHAERLVDALHDAALEVDR